MSRRQAFIVSLGVLATLGVALANALAVEKPDYGLAILLLVGMSLVGAFDVWLPRGDYSEMGGALVYTSGLLLPPLVACAVILVSRLVVWGTRRFAENPWHVVEDVARRAMLASWSMCLFRLVGGSGRSHLGTDSGFLGRALVVAVFYFAMDLAVTQLSASMRLGTPYVPLLLGNLRLQGWMSTAQVSAGLLAVLTYEKMQGLGLGIVVGLLLVMRQSFSLLVEVRQAYRSTIEALARAIEAPDSNRRGHAERVAELATETGRVLGMHGRRLEALTYAALFHDVGRLDADDSAAATGGAEVLQAVGFLAASVPILRIIDMRGEVESSQTEGDLIGAYVVARMSDYDSEAQGLPLNGGAGTADVIGARLYVNTRTTVDRAIRRVQHRASRGDLPTTRAALEDAW